LIFPNHELTKKGHHYTLTFLPQDAEKFHNQDHVYYFSKHNNKFTLRPYQQEQPKPQNEVKLRCAGEAMDKNGELNYYAFNSYTKTYPYKDLKIFFISKKHPQIKRLLKEGKLQRDKIFTIRYGKVDKIESNFAYTFNEFNQELEIAEV